MHSCDACGDVFGDGQQATCTMLARDATAETPCHKPHMQQLRNTPCLNEHMSDSATAADRCELNPALKSQAAADREDSMQTLHQACLPLGEQPPRMMLLPSGVAE